MRQMLAVLMLVVASAAHGEIYTWTDSRGTAHFTNRMDEIPVRYREGAKPLNYGDEPQAGGSAREAGSQPPAARPVPQAGEGARIQGQTPPPGRRLEERRQREDARGKARPSPRQDDE